MHSKSTLAWATCLSLIVTCIAGVTELDPAIRVRNAPGASSADTYRSIGRALYDARAENGKKAMEANVTLDRSWEDAVLFTFEHETNVSKVDVSSSIEIKCTTCYIKGVVNAQLNVAENFDAGAAIQQTIGNFTDEVSNLTNTMKDEFIAYAKGVVTKFSDGIDPDDFEFPTFNHTFDLDLPPVPDTDLLVTFDGMEMYVKLATTLNLGATYTLNLFSSNTPVGLSVGKNLRAGLVFTIDLILSAQGAIEISNGFHLKLKDGIAIHIPLFGDSVSSLEFKGGQFEFLPVTIESGGIVISAILKVGVQFGIELASPATIPPFPEVAGGIEVGVFAHVAEFITNVTLAPQDKECELKVEQGFQFAVGAAAGATVMIASTEYGPAVETTVPIWYTKLAEVCAIKGKPTPTPTAAITTKTGAAKRADLTTTVLTSTIIHTGVACAESTLVNCPVSLQKTTQFTVISSHTTAVPSGETATFPQSISTGAPKLVSFGENAQTLTATSGAPVSFVPPPPPSSSSPSPSDTKLSTQSHDDDDDDDNFLSSKVDKIKSKSKSGKKPVIIGVSVGLGVAIIAVIVGVILWCGKRANKPLPLVGSGNGRYEVMRGAPEHEMSHHNPYSDNSYQGGGPHQETAGATRYN